MLNGCNMSLSLTNDDTEQGNMPIKDIKLAFSATSHIWIILTTSAILILPKEMLKASIMSGAFKGEGRGATSAPYWSQNLFQYVAFSSINCIHFIMCICDKWRLADTLLFAPIFKISGPATVIKKFFVVSVRTNFLKDQKTFSNVPVY